MPGRWIGPMLAVLLLVSAPARAEDYVFTKLADGKDVPGLDSLRGRPLGGPPINEKGEILALGFEHGIRVADGASFRKILTSPADGYDNINPGALNDAGMFAFTAFAGGAHHVCILGPDGKITGVFTGDHDVPGKAPLLSGPT